ncbi:MAG: mechanosensitive ion channel family protein [Pseudomonadota bacterium]
MFENFKFEEFFDKVFFVRFAITLGIFFFTLVVSKLIKRYVKKRIPVSPAKDSLFWLRFLHDEKKFVLKAIGWIFWILFFLGFFYIWSKLIEQLFVKVEHLYAPLARAAIIVIITVLALKAVSYLIHFITEQVTPLTSRGTARGQQRINTLNHIFRYAFTVFIGLIAALMLLENFGIDFKAILATVGVASLAIGFGAQSLVKDIVSGVFILIEDQFAVGDVAIINGEGGFVERMTLRITQLRNTEGTLITIPNGTIEMVKNLTSEWSRVDYKIGVAYSTDLDHALEVLMDEATKLKADMPEEINDEPERLGVDDFGDSAITLRIFIKTKPLKQWVVKRELNRRVHKRFEKEGIEIPFPQRTVWIKEPKESLFNK